jgi:hypothetical protein
MILRFPHLNQALPFQGVNVQWGERFALEILPTSNKCFASLQTDLRDALVLRDRSLDPPFSLVCHHDNLIAVASILVLLPRRLSIGKSIPELGMLCRYIFQSLGRESELKRLEDKVLVYPVMWLLIK